MNEELFNEATKSNVLTKKLQRNTTATLPLRKDT